LIEHAAPDERDARSDCAAREHIHVRPRAREPVDGVARNLERELTPVLNGFDSWVVCCRHRSFRDFTRRQEVLQNVGQYRAHARHKVVVDEDVLSVDDVLERVLLERDARIVSKHVNERAVENERGVAQVVCDHDRRIQRHEVKRRDREIVVPAARLYDLRADIVCRGKNTLWFGKSAAFESPTVARLLFIF